MPASRRARRATRLAAIATLALATVVLAAPAIAGSGIGAVFNLGRTNTVNSGTTLKGAAAAPLLALGNSGTGAALSLTTKAGVPPMKVSSSTKVANLNADKLDGIDSTAFMASTAHPDAATLNGVSSAGFLRPYPITQVYGPSAWVRNGTATFATVAAYTNMLGVTAPGSGTAAFQIDLQAPVSEFGFRYALGSVNLCLIASATAHVDYISLRTYPSGPGVQLADKQDTTSHTTDSCFTVSMDTPTEGGHVSVVLVVTFDAAYPFGIREAAATWVPMGPVPVSAAPATSGSHPSSGSPARTPLIGEAPAP
ncbi:MAG: hypothetical protein WCK58_12910 [Chloroflexota bacterium]